jgi:hypothetical protein
MKSESDLTARDTTVWCCRVSASELSRLCCQSEARPYGEIPMTSAEHEDGEGAQPATRYASPVAAVTAILRHAKAKRLGLDTMLGRELCPEPNWSAAAAAITAGASTLPLDEVSFWRRDLKALIGDDPAFQRVVAEAVLWFGS